MSHKFLELQQLKQLQMAGNHRECVVPACDAYTKSMTQKIEMHAGKNLTWFNTADSRDDDKVRFMVLTTGNCGAIWFASALNLHEEIFTGCGIDHPIESCLCYNLQKDGNALVAASQPYHYKFGIRSDPTIKTNPLQKAFIEHGLDYPIPLRDVSKLPWYVFDEIEDMPFADSKKVLGSVHAFSATEFAGYYQNDPNILKGRRVIIANMIRHPLTRVESYINAFEAHHLEQYRMDIDNYIREHADEMKIIEKCFGISIETQRSRAIIATYRLNNQVKWVADELKHFLYMKAFKMESLQTDPDYFANAVSILTSGRVFADNNYLDQVFKPENLGVGRRCNKPDGTRPPSPRDQWEIWSDWERFEFRNCCLRDNIYEAYAEYDYDFSYIR